jgi:hypothetical protein
MAQNIFGRISERLGRTLLIALAGQFFFLVSVISMIPLRMAENPVEDYNLFYMPILAMIFLVLFYRTCVEKDEARGILYGYFAALVAWPCLGEIASLPVEKGIVTQFCSVDIKLLGAYYYVAACWMLLPIMWRTKAVKSSVLTFFLIFLGIWSFELYMENYSARVPIDMMPMIAQWVTIVSLILSIIILVTSWRTTSTAKKTLMGTLLYLTFSLVLMSSGPWKKPSTFYVKYEASHIDHELEEVLEEKEYLEYMKQYMLEKGMLTGKDIKYMLDKNLIEKEAVLEVVNKGILKKKEINFLRENGIIKSEEEEIKESH